MSPKWIVRFLDLARTVSQWSKDPSTKVGAVIADNQQRVVSLGFNGFPLAA
jgi:dCMP deaminase